MRTYRIHTRPDLRLAAHGHTNPTLSSQALVERLADATVHELVDGAWGQEFELSLSSRELDADALERIEGALQELGFSVLEATVREWTSEALARAILGGGGGLALGGGLSENLLVGIMCSAAGGLVGAWSGARARELVTEYEAHRNYRGDWTFREIRPASAKQPETNLLYALR